MANSISLSRHRMELVAYHEAGHAFMAIYLGADVRSVTIDPDRDDGPQRTGDTTVLWPRLALKKYATRAIQVCLAGPVAEMLYTGEKFHPAHVAEWAADWDTALALCEPLEKFPAKRVLFLEETSLRLYRLLDAEPQWSAVAEIADHLLAHDTLEGEQVREIVEQWLS